MPSHKPWPRPVRGEQEDFLIRDPHTYQDMIEARLGRDAFRAHAAQGILSQHYIACTAMNELKAVLDRYVDGGKS